MQGTELSVVCDGLLSRIFHRPNENHNEGFVVAVTSAHPGAGVSYITNALASTLDPRFTSLLNGRNMAAGEMDYSFAGLPSVGRTSKFQPRDIPGRFFDNWHQMRIRVAEYLENARKQYRYVLIDCPSLRESQHAVFLAPLVDGVVIIVEANRTHKEQLFHAERTIENARGRILGHVLNKRTYVVPNWLHRRMEAVGI